MIYLIDYFSVLFVGLLLSANRNISSKRKKRFLIISTIILVITLGLRATSVGEDTEGYWLIARTAKNLDWKQVFAGFPRSTWRTTYYTGIASYDSKIESGYLILVKILMLISNSPLFVQFVCAFLTLYLFFKFIYDNSENVLLSVMAFIGEAMFMNAFNLQRQMLAMAIGLNAYTLFKDKQYKKGTIVILLASLFHTSALLFLVFVPLSFVKNYQRGMKFTAFATFALAVFSNLSLYIVGRFFPVYLAYTTGSYWESGLGKTLIMWIIEVGIMALMYIYKIKNQNDYMSMSCVTLYIAIEILALNLPAFSRAALFFRAFIIILIPNFLKYLKSKQVRLLFTFSIIAIFALQLFSASQTSSRIFSFGF